MSFEIRTYRDSDRTALIMLAQELQSHEGNLFDRMKPEKDIADWYIEMLLQECARHEGEILVAADGSDVFGYAVILTRLSSKEEIDEVDYTYAYVQDIVVTENARGNGVGRRLLSECEERARVAGVKWMRITALAENERAIETYRSFGFRPLFMDLEKEL